MKEKIKTIFSILCTIAMMAVIFYLVYSGYLYLLLLCFIYIGLITIFVIPVVLFVSNIFDNYLGVKQENNESSIKRFIRKNQKIIIPITITLAIIAVILILLYLVISLNIKLVPSGPSFNP